MVGIIPQCHAYLQKNAVGRWYESYRFKNKDTDDYLHPVQRGMLLLRVETETKRAFYWIYKFEDAIGFNEYVGLKMKAECHEIIISSRCRLFYDIDLALDEFQQFEFAENYGYLLSETNQQAVMEEVSKLLATVFKEATLLSLEEHGVDADTVMDWMWTMRNRPLKDSAFKISIHLVSNLMLSLRACSAIASDVKREVLFNNEAFLGISVGMAEALSQSIDEMQYRRHGSLSLPFGTKQTSHGIYTNWIIDEFNIPGQQYFITTQDQFSIDDLDISGYNIVEKSNYDGVGANPVFVKEALAHAHNIKDYSPRVWDLNASVLKRSTMYVKRYAPSMCSICGRVHDNDNTLFLIFNSEAGVASWKCARMPSMKPIVFYAKEINDLNNIEEPIETDIDAFAMNYRNPTNTTTIAKRAKPVAQQSHRISDDISDDLEAFNKRYKNLRCSQASNDDDIADPFDHYGMRARKTFMRYGPPKIVVDDFREITGKEGYDSDDSIHAKKGHKVLIAIKSHQTKMLNEPEAEEEPDAEEEPEAEEELETYDDDEPMRVRNPPTSRVKVVGR